MPEIAGLFELSMNPLELIARGTLMYWVLFLLFRCILRRDVGSIAIADVLLLLVLVLTSAGWNWLFDWLLFRFSWVRRLLAAKPLTLVSHGKVRRRNMRKEMISLVSA